MQKNTLSPFSGSPPTRLTMDATGKPEITLKPAATGPLFTKIADRTALVGTLVVGGASAYGVASLQHPTVAGVLILSGTPVLAWAGQRFGLRYLLRRQVSCKFTLDQFSFSTVFGTKRFDRSLPHRFVLHKHKKAEREQQKLSFIESKRSKKWWGWSPKRYYSDSYHLVFEYMDQRHDMLSIYGPIKAEKIFSRLKACEDYMAGQESSSRGVALEAKDDWSPQPGGLSGLN